MDIICEVKPKHKKNVCVENGVKVLYLHILKSLCGCMEYEILRYDIYSKPLKPQGLLINQYDRCIINSTIKDKQLKIERYVGDKKVSNVDEIVTQKSD